MLGCEDRVHQADLLAPWVAQAVLSVKQAESCGEWLSLISKEGPIASKQLGITVNFLWPCIQGPEEHSNNRNFTEHL